MVAAKSDDRRTLNMSNATAVRLRSVSVPKLRLQSRQSIRGASPFFRRTGSTHRLDEPTPNIGRLDARVHPFKVGPHPVIANALSRPLGRLYGPSPATVNTLSRPLPSPKNPLPSPPVEAGGRERSGLRADSMAPNNGPQKRAQTSELHPAQSETTRSRRSTLRAAGWMDLMHWDTDGMWSVNLTLKHVANAVLLKDAERTKGLAPRLGTFVLDVSSRVSRWGERPSVLMGEAECLAVAQGAFVAPSDELATAARELHIAVNGNGSFPAGGALARLCKGAPRPAVPDPSAVSVLAEEAVKELSSRASREMLVDSASLLLAASASQSLETLEQLEQVVTQTCSPRASARVRDLLCDVRCSIKLGAGGCAQLPGDSATELTEVVLRSSAGDAAVRAEGVAFILRSLLSQTATISQMSSPLTQFFTMVLRSPAVSGQVPGVVDFLSKVARRLQCGEVNPRTLLWPSEMGAVCDRLHAALVNGDNLSVQAFALSQTFASKLHRRVSDATQSTRSVVSESTHPQPATAEAARGHATLTGARIQPLSRSSKGALDNTGSRDETVGSSRGEKAGRATSRGAFGERESGLAGGGIVAKAVQKFEKLLGRDFGGLQPVRTAAVSERKSLAGDLVLAEITGGRGLAREEDGRLTVATPPLACGATLGAAGKRSASSPDLAPPEGGGLLRPATDGEVVGPRVCSGASGTSAAGQLAEVSATDGPYFEANTTKCGADMRPDTLRARVVVYKGHYDQGRPDEPDAAIVMRERTSGPVSLHRALSMPRLGFAPAIKLQMGFRQAPFSGRRIRVFTPPVFPARPPSVHSRSEAPTRPDLCSANVVAHWTCQDVLRWIALILPSIAAAETQRIFSSEEIAGDVLLSMSEDDLSRIGIRQFGRRRTLFHAIDKLRNVVSAPPARTTRSASVPASEKR